MAAEYRGKYPWKIRSVGIGKIGEQRVVIVQRNDGIVFTMTAQELAGRTPKPGQDAREYKLGPMVVTKSGVVKQNPKKNPENGQRIVKLLSSGSARMKSKTKPNPRGRLANYSVQWARPSSDVWRTVATFDAQDDAAQYARSNARKNPRVKWRVIK